MEKNDTERWSIKKELVDRYFNLKILEANQEGEEELLNALVAARYLWQDRRQLDAKLAAVIIQWDEDCQDLHDLVDAPTVDHPFLETEARQGFFLGLTSLVNELFMLIVLTFCMAVMGLLYLITGINTDAITGLAILSSMWLISAVRVPMAWKKEKR